MPVIDVNPGSKSLVKVVTTNFTLTESPISEAGTWYQTSVDWTPVVTAGGVAYGTQTGTVGPPFNDSFAYLAGFPPNHQAIGVVHRSGTIDSSTREAECLVRWADSTHTARGYEFNYAYNGAYCGIVRWNGPLNDFTPIPVGNPDGTPNGALADGDLLRLDAIGANLIAYRSTDGGSTWVQVAAATDTTWSDGNPGMGFWKDGGTNGNSNLGFSAFIARSL